MNRQQKFYNMLHQDGVVIRALAIICAALWLLVLYISLADELNLFGQEIGASFYNMLN